MTWQDGILGRRNSEKRAGCRISFVPVTPGHALEAQSCLVAKCRASRRPDDQFTRSALIVTKPTAAHATENTMICAGCGIDLILGQCEVGIRADRATRMRKRRLLKRLTVVRPARDNCASDAVRSHRNEPFRGRAPTSGGVPSPT